MQIKNILLIYMKPRSIDEHETIVHVLKSLRKQKIRYKIIERSRINKKICSGYDLIIVIGGDGTFLRTSHFVDDTPILGVNANIQRKEGFLMQTNISTFKKRFKDITKKLNIIDIGRLETIIIRKEKQIKLPLALNEVFIGHKLPYKMSRYRIMLKQKEEFQKSSGIIIGTAIGSHAWISSAGGRKVEITEKLFQYVVREPYEGRLHQHKITKGFFKENEEITIMPASSHLIISIDSLSEEFAVMKDDIIVVKPSDRYLKYVEQK
ncbi:NAD(+)/NADH kinase [Candidatus Woesearchaeota archaeon]|nr:NAD(+)/NADH kinase [Candidatus Woesearchaeota archaeon]